MPLRYEDDGPPPKGHPIRKTSAEVSAPSPRPGGGAEMNYQRALQDWTGYKAKSYDDGRQGNAKWEAENAGIEKLYRAPEGARVLDAGCGTGRLFSFFKSKGAEIAAIDASEEMLKQAKQKHPDIQELHVADIMQLPVGDKAAHTTVCLRLLEKFTEPEMAHALSELCRVSEHHVIVGLLTGKEIEKRNRANVARQRVFESIVEQCGFRIEDVAIVRQPDYYIWRLGRVR